MQPEIGSLLAAANAALNAGNHAEAIALCARSRVQAPSHAEAWYLSGVVAIHAGQPHEAIEFFRRTLVLQTDHALAAYNLAVAHKKVGQAAEAEAAFRQAILLSPDFVEAHLNLGSLCQVQGRLDEAIAHYQNALVTGRRLDTAYYNLATAYEAKGAFTEALAHLDQAILQKPDFPEAQRNKGLISLMVGHLADGWRAYEWRWKCHDFVNLRRPFPQPVWDGTQQSVLVWGEQGLGDEILYGGMVLDLVRRGLSVVWEVSARLVPLVQRGVPGVAVAAQTTPPDPVTASATTQIPIAGLGQHLRAQSESFPATTTYLRADRARVDIFRKRLGAGRGKKIIGLSWMSKAAAIGTFKSLQLTDLAPILHAKAATFVDLQYGDTAQERAEAATAPGVELQHFPDLDMFEDIDGLAALISACDLVITVSNTTAHLAGALGVPVWILVPQGTGKLWYWGEHGDTTPWYRSARLFRQKVQGDWRGPIAEIAAALDS